nr:TonB-dependent receptor [Erythrobacter crassostrea]
MAQEEQSGDTPEVEEDEGIIVTGLRESLATSQAQKRNADTVVDVVTASDIGALPDRSVSEVLQRVPGVSVLRFAGPNDPDHFAVEGSGVVIRGLPFVRSELNGRDVFAANSSGILGFEDVSPELLGSVVVFKNSTADLVEGGAAGTIDLRTRVPFDQAGLVVSGSIEGNYGDLSDEWSPSGSLLISNTWNTDAGTFGLLGNIAYSELKSRADGTGIADYVQTDDGFVPSGGSIRTQEFDRERLTIAAAAQFESNDGKWLATAQFLRSDSDLVWGENAIETAADGAGARANLDSSDFTFDADGVFTSGTITDNSQWRGPNATAANLGANGGQQLSLTRNRSENDITTDYGFNLKFSPTENLRFNFDAQYIEATTDIVDITQHRSFFSPVFINTLDEDSPVVEFQLPTGEAEGYFQDPSRYFLRSAMDHITQNEADSLAFRGDVEYDFSGDGWLKSVRAGARYNKQDLLLRQSDFNWGNISEVWTGNDIQGQSGGDFNQTQSLVLVSGNANPAIESAVNGLFGQFEFADYQRGVSTGLGGPIPAYTGPSVLDYDGFAASFNTLLDAIGGSPSGWTPLTGRNGVVEGTPFLPSEIGSIERETLAGYVRVDFEAPESDGGVVFSGNVGLRYVRTDRSVDTSITVDPFDQIFAPGLVALCDPANQPNIPTFTVPGICQLDLAAFETAFGDGRFITETVETDYDEFLPSLNLKLDIPGGHVLRTAVSRTLTRPGVDQLNERIFVQTEPGETIADGMGGSIQNFGRFVGNATGNASLLPQTAWNFDVSWEWYFDTAGSITVAGFHKEVDDFIAFSPLGIPLEFEGLDLTIARNTEVNTDQNGSVSGVEIAYQQFYDFLPGILNGLGAQFTYTYIDARGVANQLDPALASDDPPTARFDIDSGVFPRISEHNINAIALYEKGPVQARLAYNWRSEFQLTPRDVIFPFASIYQPATGQLDASLFVDVNDNITVGVQGVNLTDDITATTQTVNEAGLQAPRNYFRNDRRFTFILRANF